MKEWFNREVFVCVSIRVAEMDARLLTYGNSYSFFSVDSSLAARPLDTLSYNILRRTSNENLFSYRISARIVQIANVMITYDTLMLSGLNGK
jgi:hypothetical protein